MARSPADPDVPIVTTHPGDPAPGLEGVPRADLGPTEAAVPSLVDLAVRGPVVLTRHGHEAFVLLPLDVWRAVWGAAPRPPVLEARPRPKPKP